MAKGKKREAFFWIDSPLADQLKAIDEGELYIQVNLPEELQPGVDRYRERMKNLPLGKEKRELRDQFKGFLTEYLERENKELFDQRKDEISQVSDQFLNIFDHLPCPNRDRHIPGENTSLQE